MRKTDTITFVVPAYNASQYLAEAITSIQRAFACTGEKILVVDDGSSDTTSQIAHEAGVRCIRHPSNCGIAATLNTGIAAAETEYVAWLSADDLYTEDAGRTVESAMQETPDADFYFGHYQMLYPDGLLTEPPTPSLLEPLSPDVTRHDYFVDLLFGNFINGSTTIMRRRRVIELGLFDPRHRYAQDYAMWLLMAYHKSKAVYIPEPIGIRRVHEGQLSYRSSVRYAMWKEDVALLRRYLNAEGMERLRQRMNGARTDPDLAQAILIKKLLRVGLVGHAIRVFRANPGKVHLAGLVAAELTRAVMKNTRRR